MQSLPDAVSTVINLWFSSPAHLNETVRHSRIALNEMRLLK